MLGNLTVSTLSHPDVLPIRSYFLIIFEVGGPNESGRSTGVKYMINSLMILGSFEIGRS